jgi:hypothetical protein
MNVVLRGDISSSEVKITRTDMMDILYNLNDIEYAKYDEMKDAHRWRNINQGWSSGMFVSCGIENRSKEHFSFL